MSETFGVDPEMVPRPEGWRIYAVWGLRVVIFIVVLNVAAFVLRAFSDPMTYGPAGSTFVTSEDGHGAWRDLLVDIGRPTERSRTPIAEAAIDQGAALVAIAPDEAWVDPDYADALMDHVERGGLLITSADAPWFDRLIPGAELDALRNASFGPGDALPVAADVSVVEAVGTGSFTSTADAAALLSDDQGRHLALVRTVGAGQAVALSDITPLSNLLLADDDNAAFAVAITDGRPVVFDEYIHGYTSGGGIGDTPMPVQVMLITLGIAAAVWMWAVGRRFGPPEQRARHLPLPRARYVDGLGASLAKAAPDEGTYGALRQRGLRILEQQAKRHTGLTSDAMAAAAESAGLTNEELAALQRPVTSAADAATVAAAMSKLEERRLLASTP